MAPPRPLTGRMPIQRGEKRRATGVCRQTPARQSLPIPVRVAGPTWPARSARAGPRSPGQPRAGTPIAKRNGMSGDFGGTLGNVGHQAMQQGRSADHRDEIAGQMKAHRSKFTCAPPCQVMRRVNRSRTSEVVREAQRERAAGQDRDVAAAERVAVRAHVE